MVELDRNELAWDPVQARIREPLLACAWLRAVPDERDLDIDGAAHASYAGPLGGAAFVLAVTSQEAVALDVRWPEPAVSILARWPLASIQSERTGQDEMRLRAPGKIDTKVRLEHPGPGAVQLLDLLAPLEGESLPSKKRPSRIGVLLGAAVLVVACPSLFFYRAVAIEGYAPSEALADSLVVALVVAPVMAVLVVWEFRKRVRR